ncbi:hypothetical protein ASG54_08470 [Aureimonas sp. Leaf460]|nr:hypothetical protein ASG54_08470 [Aureimonas sp. Leaf460]
MTDDALTDALVGALQAAFALTAPILGVALAIGLFLGILQAALQLQEQTIPQIVKIGAIGAMLAAGGTTFCAPLLDYTRHIMTDFPVMVR